ncbi:MAG TPA: tyrosine-type recombinase/integrase [Verrucomicrobiae bacterium]|nr:tyrosine-type recombinase/integrase [Verrucomicrobiae bacterium]
MPWLFKYHNSKVWWVGYRLHGQQFLRSTGQRQREYAEKELQRVNSMIAAHKADALSHGLFEHLTGKALPSVTLKHALDDWLNEATGSAGPRTVEKYRSVAGALSDFFKANDRGPLLSKITAAELTRLLGEKRATVSAATTNLLRTCLAIFFKRSKLRGYIRDNPIDSIRTFKAGSEEKRARRPFTMAELATLYKVAPDDFWRFAVVGGFTTGLRLGDLVTMPLGAVDWKGRCLRLNVRKTGKKIYIPLAPAFLKILKAVAADRAGSVPTEPFWPEHAARYEKSGAGWFSQRFYDLVLVKAGLASTRPHRPGSKKKSDRRAVNEVSFHCLRHSCVSTHAANRQNQQLVKALAGHSSDEVNDLYTTLPADVLAKAVAELPDITKI